MKNNWSIAALATAAFCLALASLFGGIALTNAGLGAVHGFAAPLGGSFPVPHGVVCAALLPHVIRMNVQALRERQPGSAVLARYAMIGRTLTGRRELADEQAVDAAVAFIQELTAYMQIPRLREYGISEATVAPMVQLAKKSSSMRYNPIVLTDEELGTVLSAAV